ncbi:MAG: Uma2 family endonuclease [Rhodothermales bacterium]|nr:Uma2 family endonuclease [Rhodothermales bacterium]
MPDPEVYPAPHRFSIEDYLAMGRAGILSGKDRVEFIDGQVVEMSPIADWHIKSVRRLGHLLRGQLPSSVVIDAQNALDVGQHTQVVPDLMVLPEASLSWEWPVAGHECLLLIEVADSSLEADRTTKSATYAAAEVPEYWIVDLAGRAVEVYRDPSAGRYASRTVYGAGAVISAVLVPGLAVPVADVVPPKAEASI